MATPAAFLALIRSTTAAVGFIRGLKEQLGSLYLAAAAYNGGPGRIARGLSRYADDLEGTTGLLQRWIDTSPSKREAMRQNARKCFEQRFEINRAVDSLLQILNEPLKP